MLRCVPAKVSQASSGQVAEQISSSSLQSLPVGILRSYGWVLGLIAPVEDSFRRQSRGLRFQLQSRCALLFLLCSSHTSAVKWNKSHLKCNSARLHHSFATVRRQRL